MAITRYDIDRDKPHAQHTPYSKALTCILYHIDSPLLAPAYSAGRYIIFNIFNIESTVL